MKQKFGTLLFSVAAIACLPLIAAGGSGSEDWAAFAKLTESAKKLPSGKMHLLQNKLVYGLGMSQVDADGAPDATKIDPQGQNDTSLHIDGKPVNARKIPFYVLPLNKFQKFHIALGDFAAVRCKRTHKLYGGIFADEGPTRKFGETSMYMNSKLGFSNSPIDGGTNDREVEYLIFPGSRDPKIKTDAAIQNRVHQLLQENSK